MEYLFFKWLHILSSTVLFGTGVGSAFYMLVATLSRDLRFIAAVTRWVVRADWLFTATTAILQPATGLWMMHIAGMSFATPWVRQSIWLYIAAIACWLPVVWLQIRLRDLAGQAALKDQALPRAYWRYFTAWVALGTVAFVIFLLIFWLMVSKQAWGMP